MPTRHRSDAPPPGRTAAPRAAIGPPARPPAWQEAVGDRLFRALAPRLARRPRERVPAALEPCEVLALRRGTGRGALSASWFPAPEPSRGVVLLVHPWLPWGRTYFYRHGRVQALRAAGYDALAVDLAGFGRSGAPAGFFDRDVRDALRSARHRAAGHALHLWGISLGGYWSHQALSRGGGVDGAMFEDVSPHLLEWSWRMAPLGRPCYLVFRSLLRQAYRFLDLRRHAPFLRARAVSYVSGGADRGVPTAETRRLAQLASASYQIVPGAGHLESVKLTPRTVVATALATFERSEVGRSRARPSHQRS